MSRTTSHGWKRPATPPPGAALAPEVAPQAREELKQNLPAYVVGENTGLWTLQNFMHHCSLRFSTEFFATQKDRVGAAGEESGAGFVKLPYDRELPVELLTSLMHARLEQEFPSEE